MIRVVHTVRSLTQQSGGPARCVTALTDSLANEINCSVVLLSQGHKDDRVVAAAQKSRVDRRIAISGSELVLTAGLPLKRMLYSVVGEYPPTLLHDHGIWMPSNHYVAGVARKFGIPLVINPRGMLEPWALRQRRWKKRLALRFYQTRDLETAALLFATAEQEADSIRSSGLRNPIAVIPNGVEVVAAHPDVPLRESTCDAPRTALFLSRIHPKKGLLTLIEAWSRVGATDWRLQLAGPDEGGHISEVMRKVQVLGLQASVEYVGEVEGNTKAALFQSADLFVLPSFSENFGVVVAEALSYGVPVITTRGTPWEGLVSHGCGWWVEPKVDELAVVLEEAMNMEAVSLQAMGLKGREYVREFDWSQIAQQTADVYRWVLGQGPMPECVIRD